METLFLKILNMSITASYVIPAVLLLRLLLCKAPKKYSYLLWSVVGFRLICPVSFQSIFSLFNLQVRIGNFPVVSLQEIPADVTGNINSQVKTGIPAVNTLMNQSLPAATISNRVSPQQLVISVCTALWCIGMAAFLLYALFGYVRLYRRMHTAVVLDGNVYQSDTVRSPFILGFFRPRIYIPFGLDENTMRYILTHERYHLKRKDHIIKLIAFLLLAVYWFNPLSYLAFYLMGKDMEMSCDEKVLSGEENIVKAYCTSLLSFASNRRFPVPSPLAFGESGVKSRIKNALRWKKPKVWITIAAILLCILALIICTANPKQRTNTSDTANGAPNTVSVGDSYVSTDCLYMNPLSSYLPDGDSGYRYVIGEESFLIVNKTDNTTTEFSPVAWGWQEFPYSKEEWEALFIPGGLESFDIDIDYTEAFYQPLSDRCFLLSSDGALYLVQTHFDPWVGEYIWSIYALAAENSASQNDSNRNTPDSSTPSGTNTDHGDALATESDPLDTAIRKAVLTYHEGPNSHNYFCCESHITLGLEEESFASASADLGSSESVNRPDHITVYAMILYQEYSISDGAVIDMGGSHIPTKLSFEINSNDEYILTEYWQPRDGSYFTDDLKENFPDDLWADAMDTQKFILAQIQSTYMQAVEYFQIDTGSVIEGLFETILSSPAASSSPNDYITAHPIEYRELTRYGDYTLCYVFQEFLKGGQTDLKGQLMKIVMIDLLGDDILRLATDTGQEYFDAWLASIRDEEAKYGTDFIQEHRPKAWLLLQLIAESENAG